MLEVLNLLVSIAYFVACAVSPMPIRLIIKIWAGIYGILLGLSVITWSLPEIIDNAVALVMMALIWWHLNRRDRKRRKLKDTLGAKSKALRDALAKRIQQPAPRLQPQGTRA